MNGERSLKVETKSGVVQTPFFMPDATRASIRGMTADELSGVGVEVLVVNTYHLLLQPGEALVQRAGGIHQFMGWTGPVLSDSGGYQVFSLIHKNPELGRITEEGAEFRSVLDGSIHLLTPERSIQIQFDLGVDMMVCLDDPRPNHAPDEEMSAAVERTSRWAERCRTEYDRQIAMRDFRGSAKPLLFGVVQGGLSRELRQQSAEALIAIGFDGYGFGGRHIDSEGQFLEDIVGFTASMLPAQAIRFALGIGTPTDIVRCYQLGWDIFDCVIPTREGRHGRLFVWRDSPLDLAGNFYETMNIHNEQYTEDFRAVDPRCDCVLCLKYTRSYLKHLFKAVDPLAGRLASIHNLRFYTRLMTVLRK